MTQAIQTRYKGYHFRSRLEARWAVFFDTLGVEYEYELEGYRLGEGVCYLPDFYLPKFFYEPTALVDGEDQTPEFFRGSFVEVKPSLPDQLENEKYLALAGEAHVFLAAGNPANSKGLYYVFSRSASLCFLRFAYDGTSLFLFDEAEGMLLCNSFTSMIPLADRDEVLGLINHPRLEAAYTAARSARFEHGKAGAT